MQAQNMAKQTESLFQSYSYSWTNRLSLAERLIRTERRWVVGKTLK